MASLSARDRRSPLFGSSSTQADARIDPESLERDNDRDIDSLADKTSFLRKVTSDINAEVDSQNRVLDNMGSSMGGVQIGLGAAVTRFKRVFDDPKKKRNLILVLGVTMGLFIIYLLAQRARKQ
ncbi:g8678 [Coccomyxa viridis]|uniref:G8678 protein n=1 Tax=Coccomyxa viridis TaxID=1274662 RepID=A0ABP1G0Z7_9CHLO